MKFQNAQIIRTFSGTTYESSININNKLEY